MTSIANELGAFLLAEYKIYQSKSISPPCLMGQEGSQLHHSTCCLGVVTWPLVKTKL